MTRREAYLEGKIISLTQERDIFKCLLDDAQQERKQVMNSNEHLLATVKKLTHLNQKVLPLLNSIIQGEQVTRFQAEHMAHTIDAGLKAALYHPECPDHLHCTAKTPGLMCRECNVGKARAKRKLPPKPETIPAPKKPKHTTPRHLSPKKPPRG